MAPVKSLPKTVFRSCIIPVVSVRETEAQTGFRNCWIVLWYSKDTFYSLMLTERKMLFFSSQNLEDTEVCRQSSCYSNRGVIPFHVLPEAFTLLVAWVKILGEVFCTCPVKRSLFHLGMVTDFSKLSFSVSLACFHSSPYCWEIEIFLLVWEVQLAEGLWAVRTEVTSAVWNSFDAVWILLVWDVAGETPVTALLVEALVWKTQTFGVSRQIKPSHWLSLALM